MKLSIITINYNNCKGLERTLHSIQSQTSHDFEWIVIDGGSTDGSRELIEQHQDSMSYWCSEPDKGRYNAMNKGVLKAKGEYCLFLNSGDHLCNEKIIKRLNETPFTADLVSCDLYVDGISPFKINRSVDNVNAFWALDNTLSHPSTWIRREILIRCPYRENFERISDWTFFFEAIVIFKCSYQHIPIAISVFYTDGISSTPVPAGNNDRTLFLSEFFPLTFIAAERSDPFHGMTIGISRMTKFGKALIAFLFKLVAYLEYKLFLPIGKIWLFLKNK